MPTNTKWKVAILVVVLVFIFLLPEVVSAGWRVLYGPTVDFRGWDVTPPFEWFAKKTRDGMAVERMMRLPWQEAPHIEFQIVHFGPKYSYNPAIYGKEQERTFLMRGYLQVSKQHIQIAGADGDCWKFVSVTRPEKYWISCFVPKDLTSADYIGTKSYVNAFTEILGRIKRVN